MAPLIGQTVSHYRILEKLGEGGMGVVYKAEDLTLTRTVALKFLPHGLEAHESERARFLQEARAAAILNHPNICTIHEIAEVEGQQFIVMEHVEGKTVRKEIEDRGLKIEDCIRIAIQIGEALQEAHSKAIVHRDIKAENIMVNTKGQVKVMDFGLAKLKGSLKLTRTSSTVGTLAYMAPEQIEGGEVDARSDIFSFGVLLYEMLTGHTPFRGEHEAAVMYSIINEEPEPLQSYVADAPPELLHLLSRALEKDPEDRYQAVHEMLIDLRRLKKESTRVVRPPDQKAATAGAPPRRQPRWSKRRIAMVLGGTAGLVCAAFAILLLSRAPQLNPEMKFRVLQLPFRDVSYATISRVGSWIAFPARDERGKFDVYMMNVSEGQPRRITHDSCWHIYSVSLSPDESTILYSRRRTAPGLPYEIVKISSLGGTGRVVADNGYNQVWMHDGKRFGYMHQEPFQSVYSILRWWSCAPDGSDRRLEIADTIVARAGIRVSFDYSPDGRSIVWTKNFPEGYSEIMIRDRESGADRQLTYDRKYADDALWSETGYVFYSSNRGGNVNVWMIPAKGGEPVQVTRGSGSDSPRGLTADGKTLMYTEVQDLGQVMIGGIKDGNVRQLTVDERQRGMPAMSPSGKYVAFPSQETDVTSNARNIYVMDRTGGNLRKLTDDLSYKVSPKWSPDEKWITYAARPGNQPEDSSCVYLIQVDAPGKPRLMGRGGNTHWLSNTEFVIWRGLSGSVTRSIDQPESVKLSEDSILAVPVLNGKYVAALDFRDGRTGWWIATSAAYSASGLTGARRLTTGPAYGTVPFGTNDLYYVPPGTRELHRLSLPEGKDLAVRKFPGLGIFFSICAATGEIAYTEVSRKMRFVLVENVFK